jgi:hypothetical protein
MPIITTVLGLDILPNLDGLSLKWMNVGVFGFEEGFVGRLSAAE